MNIQMPSHNERNKAFVQGESAIVDLFDLVGVQMFDLAVQLEKQGEVIKELQTRLSKDSSNSSKPPSTDGYAKKPLRPESLREKGQKPNGGQPGHEGHTLKASDTPNQITLHEIEECEHCHADLKRVNAEDYEERQVFDIPAIRIEVTAHRALNKICPVCGQKNLGKFPEEVLHSVQYLTYIKTWAAYFTNQHHIPAERTTQIIEDLTHHRVSEALVLKSSEELSKCIRPSTEVVKEMLQDSEVLNLDESGIRVKGKLHWLHVASTKRLTSYEVHAKRGCEAMDDAGIIENFEGTAVHDHWKPYFKYDNCNHALCNAHHLRELKLVEKQYEHFLAKDMAALLLSIKDDVEKTKPHCNHLEQLKITSYENRYDEIVKRGFEMNPRPPPSTETTKKRGRTKQTPPINLLIRLRDYKPQVLTFMHDFRVPFDNNQAERDVRMVKVKQKVSGCFRTVEGAKRFGCIRGYISTARKHAKNAFEAIKEAFNNNPFIPFNSN